MGNPPGRIKVELVRTASGQRFARLSSVSPAKCVETPLDPASPLREQVERLISDFATPLSPPSPSAP